MPLRRLRYAEDGTPYTEIVLFCADCEKTIYVQGDYEPTGKELCQRCDPAFASLLDNKYHKPMQGTEENPLIP